ncbi:hypothetical protein D3C73_1083520 [compost metagenome]
MRTVRQGHFDGDCSFDIGIAFIYGKGLVCHNRLVSRQEKCPGDQGDNLIRAAAKDNVAALHSEMLSQRRRQFSSRAVRVQIQVVELRTDGGFCTWRRPVRVLIGGQLNDIV